MYCGTVYYNCTEFTHTQHTVIQNFIFLKKFKKKNVFRFFLQIMISITFVYSV